VSKLQNKYSCGSRNLHDHSNDFARQTSHIFPAIILITPLLRSHVVSFPILKVRSSRQAHILRSDILFSRNEATASPIVMSGSSWIKKTTQNIRVAFTVGAIRINPISHSQWILACLVLLRLFRYRERNLNLQRLRSVMIVVIVGSKWSLQWGWAGSLRQYSTGECDNSQRLWSSQGHHPTCHKSCFLTFSTPTEHGVCLSCDAEHIQLNAKLASSGLNASCAWKRKAQ
jgi:hypothetical protein